MKYLADTNIFLEILLGQQNSSLCKEFLTDIKNEIFISDFSLHTIGVILCIASAFNLRIKTQDRDFKRIKSEITVEFF
ncbi:MAG: hypothetical protein KF687_16530 [Cyclobacteriaceae bacterium]|nr:hypothetical protein [Cyclobacteriaceae bacterium]